MTQFIAAYIWASLHCFLFFVCELLVMAKYWVAWLSFSFGIDP